MSQTDTGIRVAGAWLAIASILLTGALAFHGPIHPDMIERMDIIAEGSTRWALVHWATAASLSLYAIAGLTVLAARSRLTEDWWTMGAWGVLPIGALWTITTAVAEATVMAQAAVAGNAATFEAWWSFAEGKATGFVFLALAVAVIAGNEARRASGATPIWAAWIASIAGIGAFLGWALSMWVGLGPASLLWLASSIVMSLWTAWFGLSLWVSKSRSSLAQPA